jgi:hypothetical protein
MDYRGRVAIVTGASSGIGRQLALDFAGRGARPITLAFANRGGSRGERAAGAAAGRIPPPASRAIRRRRAVPGSSVTAGVSSAPARGRVSRRAARHRTRTDRRHGRDGLLGTITSGSPGVGFAILPLVSPDHREVYLAESYFSRGVRGDRTDVVTVYDARTLQPLNEVVLPPKRAEYFPGNASSALADDGRFMAVFNLTPMTSLSLVDARARTFVAEVATPGCSLVYAAGPRRFFMLCANGEALLVTLDESGAASVARSARFFDPQTDPITEKAVRHGNEWLFVSFDGVIHPVDVSGDGFRPGEPWPLFDDADKHAAWRVGGGQLLALHAPSGSACSAYRC